jgi:bis(5'-nucleosidyl)-tetraphosphatase
MLDETLLPPKDLSSGLILIHNDGSRFRFLCLRTYESWDFTNCPVSQEEDPLEAAIDNARLALGIENPALHWGEDYRETVPFDDGRVSRYYLAESPAMDVELLVPAGAGAEDDYEFRWVTVDEAEDLLPPRLSLILDWAVGRLARMPSQ